MLSFLRKAKQKPAELPPTPPGVKEILDRGDAALATGQHEEARRLYQEALAADPPNLYAPYQLAESYLATQELLVAREWCERGLAIDPDQIGLKQQLARIATAIGDPLLALQCYESIAARNVVVENLEIDIASQLTWLGRTNEALAAFDRALVCKPDSLMAQNNRLFISNYADLMSPEALSAEHRRWGSQHESKLWDRSRGWDNPRDPEKRLRIGYLSADFRTHAVAYFIEPLLAHHDKERFDIVCFDTSTRPPDDVARRLQSLGHEWRSVGIEDNQTLAETVRAAGIDILVDLSGHSSGNRLLVFARKPAPVQASWLGYLNTTGLESIDYRITDRFLDPPGVTEHLYAERLVRLPNHACLQPPHDAPDPGPLPAWKAGRITFGSFNNWAKVTDAMKQIWADLLCRVPGSRLLIVALGAVNSEFRATIASAFAARGVTPDRIEIRQLMPFQRFLEALKEVDIGLDSYPYAGGTTTLHSLWMGVPVVTLAGRTAFSRNSIGPLSEIGLSRFVASNPEDYVHRAVELSQNLPRLANIRVGLRDRMRRSTLVDAKRFTRNLEAAYRAMWRNYCSGRSEAIDVA